MAKRGKYIIHTAMSCYNQFGGPSWASDNRQMSLKELISNELYTINLKEEIKR